MGRNTHGGTVWLRVCVVRYRVVVREDAARHGHRPEDWRMAGKLICVRDLVGVRKEGDPIRR